MAKETPAPDPNAPLEAYQRRLDENTVFFEGPGGCYHQPSGLPTHGRGNFCLGHLPGLDTQEGSPDE